MLLVAHHTSTNQGVHFDVGVQGGARVERVENGLRVSQAAPAWSYGLTLYQKFDSANYVSGYPVIINIDMTCLQGTAEICAVVIKQPRMIDAAQIRQKDGRKILQLLLDNLKDVEALVMRPVTDGQYDVIVHGITIGQALEPRLEKITPAELRPVPEWSEYYGNRADDAAQKLRARAFEKLKAPISIPWHYDMKVMIYPRNYACRAVAVSSTYEPKLLSALRNRLPAAGTFIDVGANMGLISLFAARLVGVTGCIHAFEPSPRDYNRLNANIQINKLKNTIHSFSTALGASSGTASFSIAEDQYSGHNTFAKQFPYKETKKDSVVDVPITTLDVHLEKNPLRRLDAIKLDVEGWELHALQGAKQSLLRFKPDLYIEIFPAALSLCETSLEELDNFLSALGYGFYELTDDGQLQCKLQHLTQLGGSDLLAMAN